ncbi:T9SS type A sorting domain-containing protein [Polaribacter haliotis]|uniref:T9SS type A sorting domain-containing protein n=1 Tax=Polaribacter haliotis TaxID=1888915 RepID=A0A7L8AH23_9FLAO|nr:T9SS type A sorting domain-containing protein [Polaribacter haliotis]QOD61313.1 T9SS type A sorting domain-containing protein [Polaribacter haliotis]
MKLRLLKNLLLFFMIAVCSTYGQTWQLEGNAEFTTAAARVSIAIDNNETPFVAYSDKSSDGKLHIKKFDGTNWIEVGDVASTAGMIPEMIVLRINPVTNQPWVVYKNTSTNKIDLISYDGSNWVDEGTSIGNFQPYSKIVFNIDANGNPVLAAQATTSPSYQIKLRLYAKRSANWVKEKEYTIFSNAYDLGNANTLVISEYYTFANRTRNLLKTLEYDGTTWNQTHGSVKLNSGGDNGYCDGMAAAESGPTNKFLYDYRRGNNAERQLRFENESAITGNNQIPSSNIYGLEYVSVGGKYYVMHYNPSSDLKIYEYSEAANTKTDLNINLNFAGITPSSQIKLNKAKDKLYLAYLDLTSQKVTVKYYTILPPRSVIYVNESAKGANSGNSWTDAYTSLNDALDNADANFSEIWVAKGTYKPHASDRSKAFGLSGLKLFGGFLGNETLKKERDVKTNITILSGDLNSDDTGVEFTTTTRNENSYNVVKVLGSNSEIDGFTIQDGQADGSNADLQEGSAIFINSSLENVTISNCILKNNLVKRGGTIRAVDMSGSLKIENTSIHNNLGLFGTVLYSRANAGKILDIDIINCLIYDNKLNNAGDATSPGVVAWFRQDSNATQNIKVINSTFTANTYISAGNSESTVLNASTGSGGMVNLETSNSIYYGNFSNSNSFLKSLGNSTSQSNANLKAYNCIAQDFMNKVAGTNKANIIANNPEFTDISLKDFTLSSTSPAIDSGDNTKLPASITKDILGNERIFNTTIDMGAFEFGSSPLSLNNVDLLENKITIFPNPANNFINIKTDSNTILVRMFNLLGKQVLKTDAKNIDISNLRKGIYLLKITTENGKQIIRKMLKN